MYFFQLVFFLIMSTVQEEEKDLIDKSDLQIEVSFSLKLYIFLNLKICFWSFTVSGTAVKIVERAPTIATLSHKS